MTLSGTKVIDFPHREIEIIDIYRIKNILKEIFFANKKMITPRELESLYEKV
jgi:hypothetical protein